MQGLIPLLALVSSYGFGFVFGRSTSKPLWIAAAVPAAAMCSYMFIVVGINEKGGRWGEAFSILGPFLIGGAIFYGALSYWAASRARKTNQAAQGKVNIAKTGDLSEGRTPYYLAALIVITIAIEIWRKHFA